MLDRYQAIDPEKLGLMPDVRVLDVGCGSGRHLLELSHNPGRFVGVDMARQDLRVMRFLLDIEKREGRTKGHLHAVIGAGERLPFADEFFDLVICTETLEHVPDDKAIVRELMRVLRPGGKLVISVPDEYSERLLWRFSERYRTWPGGHVRIYKRDAIAGLLRENGSRTFAIEYRHSLESIRWLVHSIIDKEWGKPGFLTKAIRWLLDKPSHRNWRVLAWTDYVGNRFLPKSIVIYGEKPERAAT